MDEVYTDDIIDKLIQGNNEELVEISPFAGCILPLIGVLGSSITIREIAESLPHYSFVFDMAALRSILYNIGYKTDKHTMEVSKIDTQLIPCLFINKNKEICVLYSREDKEFIYFNASTGETLFEEIPGIGEVYFLTKHDSDAERSKIRKSWFWKLMSKFKSVTKYLLGISLILNLTTLCVPLFIMMTYDFVIGRQNLAVLPMMATGIFLILLIDLCLRLVRAKVMAIPAGRLEYVLGTESLKQILALPSAMTERSSVTMQLSKLRLYDSIREFFTGPTALLFLEIPFIPIFLLVIAILGGNIVWVPIIAMIFFILLGICVLPRVKNYISKAAESRNYKEQLLLETLAGNLEIKAMAKEDEWMQRIRESSAKTLRVTLSASQAQVIAGTITQGVMMLCAVAVVAIGGTKAMNGDISIGALIAIMAIMWRVIAPMQGAFMTYLQFDQIMRGIKGFDELMALKPERTASSSSLLKTQFDGDIKFDRVSFRYSANLDPVLIGASFHIPKGSFVVIAGDNGSGKSTILKLLCGMYHSQAGYIYVDDTDVRQLNAHQLRRIVGYVPQHPRLFHGDIAHNLRLSDVLATDDQLREAARDAGILEDIEKLPQGFKTRIGDKATDGLPAGLQRGICIARAFVRKSPILMLDEPSGTQDRTTLQHLANQLDKMKGETTIVAVSHAPQFIKCADQVIVLDRGSIKNIYTSQEYFDSIRGRQAS